MPVDATVISNSAAQGREIRGGIPKKLEQRLRRRFQVRAEPEITLIRHRL